VLAPPLMTATPGLLSHAGLWQMEETPYPYGNELPCKLTPFQCFSSQVHLLNSIVHPFSFCMGNAGGRIITLLDTERSVLD
jgi:hypothetical protein